MGRHLLLLDGAREPEAFGQLIDESVGGIGGVPSCGTQFFAVQHDRIGGAIVGEDFAIAVKDASA